MHRHLRRIEGIAQQAREERRGGGRQLGRLEQDPVARRQRRGQGQQGELEGVVPGRDDAHHPERNPTHLRVRGSEGQSDRFALGAHPAGEMAPHVPDRSPHGLKFADLRLLARPSAVIRINRGDDLLAGALDERLKPVEMIEALAQARERRSATEPTLQVEGVTKCVERDVQRCSLWRGGALVGAERGRLRRLHGQLNQGRPQREPRRELRG